ERAIVLFGFASALRRSELAGLDLADVRLVVRGAIVCVAKSKNDQEGEGRELGVHRGRWQQTCPVPALEAWIAKRGEWDGPLFAAIGRTGVVGRSRLSGAAIAGVVKAAAKRAGLDPSRYGGHSLRAGCATSAAEGGASDLAIMGRTGHTTVEM